MSFSNILITWYLQNKRDLPWRNTKNPYFIWLSEIILQQTRVDQGLSYYKKFTEKYPTIFDLADAQEIEVLKLWQGLGYYSRARNLLFSAKYIVYELDGEFPKNYKQLLSLKGVGDYTASAIASICYNSPEAVVDGNVYRVLSRFFAISTPINSTKGIREFKNLAQTLIDIKQPGNYNQALMEFGAVLCKPQNPLCQTCPLNTKCLALKTKTVSELPVKTKKNQIKKRFFNYLIFENNLNGTRLVERKSKGIWQGLYEFPLIESSYQLSPNELLESESFEALLTDEQLSIAQFNQTPVIHKLSHQHLYTHFWIVRSNKSHEKSVLWKDFKRYPVPVLIHNFVQEYKPELFIKEQ